MSESNGTAAPVQITGPVLADETIGIGTIQIVGVERTPEKAAHIVIVIISGALDGPHTVKHGELDLDFAASVAKILGREAQRLNTGLVVVGAVDELEARRANKRANSLLDGPPTG